MKKRMREREKLVNGEKEKDRTSYVGKVIVLGRNRDGEKQKETSKTLRNS